MTPTQNLACYKYNKHKHIPYPNIDEIQETDIQLGQYRGRDKLRPRIEFQKAQVDQNTDTWRRGN